MEEGRVGGVGLWYTSSILELSTPCGGCASILSGDMALDTEGGGAAVPSTSSRGLGGASDQRSMDPFVPGRLSTVLLLGLRTDITATVSTQGGWVHVFYLPSRLS